MINFNPFEAITAPTPPLPAYRLGKPSGSLKQIPEDAPKSSAAIPTPHIPTFFPYSLNKLLYVSYRPFPTHLLALENSALSMDTFNV